MALELEPLKFTMNGKDYVFEDEDDFFRELRSKIEELDFCEIYIKKQGKICTEKDEIKFPNLYFMEVKELMRDIFA